MTDQELLSAYDRIGSCRGVARELGVARTTVQDRLAKLRPKAVTATVRVPELPSVEVPIDQLLREVVENYNRHRAHADAENWQAVKITSDAPMMIACMGDTHLDNPGCDWPTLKKQVELFAETDGCLVVAVGDATDNWVGRLERLYAEHTVTKANARRLIEWLFVDSGMQWLSNVLGNHDTWMDGAEIIHRIARGHNISVRDWWVKLDLQFPNGSSTRLHVAHDFPGRSGFHPLHGMLRELYMGRSSADILVAGHIHTYGSMQIETADGRAPVAARVRGYKRHDPYSRVKGYSQGYEGSSVCFVVDPSQTGAGRVMAFADPHQAVIVLKALQADYAKPTPAATPAVKKARKPALSKRPSKRKL